MKIAVGGLLQETNSFAALNTTLEDFEVGVPSPPVYRGQELLEKIGEVNLAISGALKVLRRTEATILPLLWGEGGAAGPVTDEAFENLVGDLTTRLKAAMPVDGVFLDLHGAMIADTHIDADGEILKRVRNVVGPNVPIVAALDLHANVSDDMVTYSDMLHSCRKYPHTDFYDTGEQGAEELIKMIETNSRPAKAFRQIGCIIPSPMQSTSLPAAGNLYAGMEQAEADHGVVASFCMGFPLADAYETGPAALAYGVDEASANAALEAILDAFETQRPGFAIDALDAPAAVRRGMAVAKTTGRTAVIADTQDNSGGGASSDSTGFIRALVSEGAQNALCGLIWDAEAAALAHNAGVGASIQTGIGGKRGLPTDTPFEGAFTVEALADGEFICTGPFFKGLNPRLGPMALLRVEAPECDVHLLITTMRCQLADQEMIRCMGVEPGSFDIIVVKSSAHFRADFDAIAGETIIGIADGEVLSDPASTPYRRLRSGVELGINGPLSGE